MRCMKNDEAFLSALALENQEIKGDLQKEGIVNSIFEVFSTAQETEMDLAEEGEKR